MTLTLDIRTKIFLLIVANVIMFKRLSTFEHTLVALIFTSLILVCVNYKRALRIGIVYLFFTIYELFFAKYVTFPIIDNFLLLSSLMFKTIYFPICAGIILVGSSKVSELMTFLRTIKMPKNVIIVLAVIFRFFPVLLTDYKAIKNSLKMKGIGTNKFYYFLHPIQFIEYVFVPYVIISTNIANDLSVSSLCRGIDNDNEATSLTKLKFRFQDYLFIAIALLATIFIEVNL